MDMEKQMADFQFNLWEIWYLHIPDLGKNKLVACFSMSIFILSGVEMKTIQNSILLF